MSADANELARRLVDSVRSGRPDGAAAARLGEMDPTDLAAALPDDTTRIAFWVNVYNAAVHARLLADPEAYRRRWRFFGRPATVIAGRHLSPNAIEHGILRRSAFLLGLGYVRNPVPSREERRWRVDRVDPRIHFALNCGARSCPPRRTWDPETLHEDLEVATGRYLAAETHRNSQEGVLVVPRLLLWYRGDFGGAAGIRALLHRHGLIGPDERPVLRYGPYDWTLALDDATERLERSPGAGRPPTTADAIVRVEREAPIRPGDVAKQH